MSRKIFVLFLVALLAVFAGNQAFAETVYELVDKDSEGAEIFEEDDVDFFTGGNFYGRYRLPELSIVSYDSENSETRYTIDTDFSVKWSLKSDELSDIIIQSEESDDQGKYLVVSGVLPAADDSASYELSFTAEITEVESEDYQSLDLSTKSN